MLIYKCDRCGAQFEHIIDGPVTHFIGEGIINKDESDYNAGLTVSITGASPNHI